eukprot:TRINITY_DN3016_c0_g3_i1.p1 TRINITY_DN3016_c0_g3~~TRINITY_DN3016_c0_g3_i1.p1  ORF type:complete len:623 (+),score=229.36 TRINITY_DN3016_c0_g3_i1:86-1870(+)
MADDGDTTTNPEPMEQAFITENIPVMLSDTMIREAIDEAWGKTSEYLRMRFLDTYHQNKSGKYLGKEAKKHYEQHLAKTTSTGKVLFKLEDPTLLLESMAPAGGAGGAIVPAGKAPTQIPPLTRAPLRVAVGPDWEVHLKVKKARGAITYPKRQTQLFVHAFPLVPPNGPGGVRTPPYPPTRLTFAAMLAEQMGYGDVSADIRDSIMAMQDQAPNQQNDLGQIIEIDSRCDTRGGGCSNLCALTIAYFLSLPAVIEKVGSEEAAYELVDKVKYFVLDHSNGPMRPKPFCFFIEMIDEDAAQEVKELLHDVVCEMTPENFDGMKLRMVLDVQYRGEGQVKKGSILDQNKTLGPKKYLDPQGNAQKTVKRFMQIMLSGETPPKDGGSPPAPRPEKKPAAKPSKPTPPVAQQGATKPGGKDGKGMNTAAKPFTPDGFGGGGDVAPPTPPGQARMKQVAALLQENYCLTQHPAVQAHYGGKAALDAYHEQHEEQVLEQWEAELEEQETELAELRCRVQEQLISREVESIGRREQLAALTAVAKELAAVLRDARAPAQQQADLSAAAAPPHTYMDAPVNPMNVWGQTAHPDTAASRARW